MAECEWAILCDYAFRDEGRKTCVVGIFDRIFTQAVPSQHHQASLVFKVMGDANEEVNFKLEISRPTGGMLGAIGGKFKISLAGTVDVIANLQGVPLPDFGLYAFALYLGDELAKTVVLTVTNKTAALPANGGTSPPEDSDS